MLNKNIMLNKFKSTRNLHVINFLHDLHENTQENSTSSNEDDQPPDCQESHPDQDLQPPMDDLLDFINSQHHSDDQLEMLISHIMLPTKLCINLLLIGEQMEA